MKVLVAPLNWGLGHASRCIPLIRRLLDEGNEVILGGDGESLTLLRKHFPTLRYTYLAPLHLRYSAGKHQVWAMLKALPQLLLWSLKDHAMLQALLREEHIDRIISDNRFGLYLKPSQTTSNHLKPPQTTSNHLKQLQTTSNHLKPSQTTSNHLKPSQTIYLTHQLHIMLPKGWRWAERIASRLHARIYTRYNKVWIPDYEEKEKSLAGELSHSTFNIQHSTLIEYIGPLSRFQKQSPITNHQSPIFDVVAVLSGLEPQRTLLEQEIIAQYSGSAERVLIVQGLIHRPNTRIKRGNITIVPSMSDAELIPALVSANRIIARSGYSTIMDLTALGLMPKATLIPTPGQPEQEYLATLYNKMK